MQDNLRERINRKLDTLSDERAYQVLDYVEFLESRYAERQNPAAIATAFARFTDTVEDSLRAGRVSATAIADTVGFMNRTANALTGALQATKAAANELVSTATSPPSGLSPNPAVPPGEQREASSVARDTTAPGTGEEKL